jgi:hypothetical protein
MPTQFTCSCGQPLSLADDADGVPVECPQCGKVYAPKPTERARPLVESVTARLAAWGCLLPLGLVLLLLAVRNLLLQQHGPTVLLAACGLGVLALFSKILERQHYSPRTFAITSATVLVLFAALTWRLWSEAQCQAELDRRFEPILVESKVVKARPKDAPLGLRAKCLPVALTERGVRERSQTPRVYQELHRQLSEEWRAESLEEVHTVILVDWWYEQVGHYVTMDALKMKLTNLYRGGCTLTVVDRDSGTIVHEQQIWGLDNAPKTRPEDDPTPWYTPQPSELEVLNYINSLGISTRR